MSDPLMDLLAMIGGGGQRPGGLGMSAPPEQSMERSSQLPQRQPVAGMTSQWDPSGYARQASGDVRSALANYGSPEQDMYLQSMLTRLGSRGFDRDLEGNEAVRRMVSQMSQNPDGQDPARAAYWDAHNAPLSDDAMAAARNVLGMLIGEHQVRLMDNAVSQHWDRIFAPEGGTQPYGSSQELYDQFGGERAMRASEARADELTPSASSYSRADPYFSWGGTGMSRPRGR